MGLNNDKSSHVADGTRSPAVILGNFNHQRKVNCHPGRMGRHSGKQMTAVGQAGGERRAWTKRFKRTALAAFDGMTTTKSVAQKDTNVLGDQLECRRRQATPPLIGAGPLWTIRGVPEYPMLARLFIRLIVSDRHLTPLWPEPAGPSAK